MSDIHYHERLRLQRFTAFEDAAFEFVPGINTFVGENGTGKTHVMKLLYAWQRMAHFRSDMSHFRSAGERSSKRSALDETFQIENIRDFNRRGQDSGFEVNGAFGGSPFSIEYKFEPQEIEGIRSNWNDKKKPPRPIFVPAIDMLGHTKGFVSTYDEYAIDFDLTHRDIVSLLLAPTRRELPVGTEPLIKTLSTALGGELELEGERFFVRTDLGKIAVPSVGEGLRKIATLLRLIQGGWLRKGTTLFWDEPEVNLNPILMDEVVGSLLTLARNGVQIMLATHSYVILKELDLQAAKEPGLVRFFSFAPGKGGTIVESTDDFSLLKPNPILDQYGYLYDRELMRATRRPLQRDH